jgi:hypothetical protein
MRAEALGGMRSIRSAERRRNDYASRRGLGRAAGGCPNREEPWKDAGTGHGLVQFLRCQGVQEKAARIGKRSSQGTTNIKQMFCFVKDDFIIKKGKNQGNFSGSEIYAVPCNLSSPHVLRPCGVDCKERGTGKPDPRG